MFGGLAGIGEKYAAVPANAVRIQPQTDVALLNATPQTLESATFKPGDLAALSSPATMQRLRQQFPAQVGGTALGYVAARSAQAEQAANERTWGPQSENATNFNTDMVKTVRGTIETIGSFRPQGATPGARRGLRLRVKMSDATTQTIYAGPIPYAEQKDFYVMPGDEVTITGVQTRIGPRSILVASELQKGSQTLPLRDSKGKPLWTAANWQSPRG